MVKPKTFSMILNCALFIIILPEAIWSTNVNNLSQLSNVKDERDVEAVKPDEGLNRIFNVIPREISIRADIKEYHRNLRRKRAGKSGESNESVTSDSSASLTLNEFGKPIRKAICKGERNSGHCTNFLNSNPFQYSKGSWKCPTILAKEMEPDWVWATVTIVNEDELETAMLLTDMAVRNQSEPGNCTVLIFYASWAKVSAKFAPNFNALPRAFKNVRFVGVDTFPHSDLITKFVIYAVPTVLLFHNGKIQARYVDESFTKSSLIDFIEMYTDQTSESLLTPQPSDYYGPIPTTAPNNEPAKIISAWIFIFISFIYLLFTEPAFNLFLGVYLYVQTKLEDVEFKDYKFRQT